MSNLSKKRNSARRLSAKRALRAANTAKYQGWADAGTNSKSKRFRLNTQRNRSSPSKHLHIIPNCGNPGCKRCYPSTKD